jgi:DNA repair ATPase RecN
MKRLDKHQLRQQADLVASLEKKSVAVSTAWEEFALAHSKLVRIIEKYNEAVDDAAMWRDKIVSDMSNYQSERSEKWMEGEAGQAYQEWIDEWEAAELESLEPPEMPEMPDELEYPHSDELENLSSEPGSIGQ